MADKIDELHLKRVELHSQIKRAKERCDMRKFRDLRAEMFRVTHEQMKMQSGASRD